MRTWRASVGIAVVLGLAAVLPAVTATRAGAVVALPPGFSQTILASVQFVGPTLFAFTPAGDYFILIDPNVITPDWQQTTLEALSRRAQRVTLGDGKTTDSSVTEGEVVVRDPLTHAVENIGNTELHALLVEFKSACR